MFLLAYILFFVNISFIVSFFINYFRVDALNQVQEDSESDNEDDELVKAFVNYKKRKRAEKPSRSTTPTIPEEDDKESTFYENF